MAPWSAASVKRGQIPFSDAPVGADRIRDLIGDTIALAKRSYKSEKGF